MKRYLSVTILLVFATLGAGTVALAQAPEQPYPPLDQQQTQPATQPVWSANELDNLVAPIALYPDPLLGQMLVASTYPLEVVEASQWLKRNANLHGQALVDAARQQPWDPSVQALVAVPDALAKLSQDIQWTTDLGNAFLAQQADVMNAVQRMRARAQVNGRLSSTPQQTVSTQEQAGQQVIIIEPAEPQVIYVPAYDPFYVWGPPVYGFYPPLYYPTYGFGFGIGFNLGFCFDDWGGWGLWGWGPSWFGRTIFVNNYFFHRYGFHERYGSRLGGRTAWVHDPVHRMHVPYRTSQVAARFRGRSPAAGNSFRSGTAGARIAGSGVGAYRGSSRTAQRYQNPPQQRYQTSQRYQTQSRQYGATQTDRVRSQPQQRYQATPRASSPRIVPFGNQATQRNRATDQYRSSTSVYRSSPQVGQSRSGQRYQAPQQFRSSAPQYRSAPQVQRYQSQPRQSFRAPQQFRSAPRMSAPRSSGGFNRSSGGNFSRGSSARSSRGGGGNSRHR